MTATIGSLAVVIGCAQPTDQPGPTEATTPAPTSNSSASTSPTAVGAFTGSAPRSSEEAVDVGARVYEQFLRTSNVVYTHPADTTLIDEIAVGAPAENIKQNAATMVTDDWRVSYADTFAVDVSRSQGLPGVDDDGQVVEFGSANVIGCVDLSARVGTWGPDQAPITNVPTPRRFVSVVVEYRPASGTFLVTDVALVGERATPC